MDKIYQLDKNAEFSIKEIRKKKRLVKKKIRIKRIKRTILFLLLVSVIVGTACSPLFKITKIDIRETEHFSVSNIASFTSELEGVNGFLGLLHNFADKNTLLRLRYGKIEDKLKGEFSYIKDVKVNYSVPVTVKVTITERLPFCVIGFDSGFLIIDDSGIVLDAIKENTQGYLQINGANNLKQTPGKEAFDRAEETLAMVSHFISALKASDEKDKNKLMPLVSSINIADNHNMRIFIDQRLIVNLGDVKDAERLKYRLDFLRQLFSTHISKKDKGTIDFTMGENPRFIPN